jgi:hypothetical protein
VKIEKSCVTKLMITGAPSLDPITVYAEDIAPRKGKIIIECYGQSWSAYWGGMGDDTIAEFFCGASQDYIANCMSRGIDSSVFDPDAAKDHAKREIIKQRRARLLSADDAREEYDEIEDSTIEDDPWLSCDLMQKIYGDEWWYRLPSKPNPDYVYLSRIIKAVQEALCVVGATP